jgi:hypothetical protein
MFQENSMFTDKIILSHPFSGSLYAFFADELGAHHYTISDHPYYLTLYGKHYQDLTDLSLTLALLYKEIIIAPADNPLPDYDRWRTERGYENEELGIYSSWDYLRNEKGEIDYQVNRDESDSIINKILRKIPKHSWWQILSDARYELLLARLYRCPVLCYGGRRALIQRLAEIDAENGDINLIAETSVQAINYYLEISGLIFHPRNIESLYILKKDKDLRSYADSFVSVMHGFKNEPNVKQQLLELAQESMGKTSISSKVVGFFNAFANVLSLFGLIPVLGTATSIAGIASTSVSYGAKQFQEKHEWYQLTPQIKKTLDLAQLTSCVDEELKRTREKH